MYKIAKIFSLLMILLTSMSIKNYTKNNNAMKISNEKPKNKGLVFELYSKSNNSNYDSGNRIFLNNGIKQNRKDIYELKYLNPTQITFDNNQLTKNEKYYILVNNQKIIQSDGLSKTKDGDKIIFFKGLEEQKKYYKTRGYDWTHCTLWDDSTRFPKQKSWLINFKFYKKKNNKVFERSQPIQIDDYDFCTGKKELKAYIWDPNKQIDINRPIEATKMLFFNLKLRLASDLMEINRLIRPKRVQNDKLIEISFKKAKNLTGVHTLDFSYISPADATFEYWESTLLSDNNVPMKKGYHYQTYEIRHHKPLLSLKNANVSTELKDKIKIEEFLSKKYKHYGANPETSYFKGLEYRWENNRNLVENNKIKVILRLRDKNIIHTINVKIPSLKQKKKILISGNKVKNEKKKKKEKENVEKKKNKSLKKIEKKVINLNKKQKFLTYKIPHYYEKQNSNNTKNTYFGLKNLNNFLTIKNMSIIGFILIFLTLLIIRINKKY